MDLFTPLTLGSLTLPNRIVMAPLTRSRATPERVPTPMMAEHYLQRASAGLIIAVPVGERQYVMSGCFGFTHHAGEEHVHVHAAVHDAVGPRVPEPFRRLERVRDHVEVAAVRPRPAIELAELRGAVALQILQHGEKLDRQLHRYRVLRRGPGGAVFRLVLNFPQIGLRLCHGAGVRDGFRNDDGAGAFDQRIDRRADVQRRAGLRN